MESPSKKARIGQDTAPDTDVMAAIEAEGDLEVNIEGSTVKVHGVILALASPVFAALLRSGMREGLARHVELPGKSKADFNMFMSFLRPVSRHRVDDTNVDRMLPWFDEYQVTSLKEQCEEVLLYMPASTQRLLQAHKYQLDRQYARCLQQVSLESFKTSFEELSSSPEVLKSVLSSLGSRNSATKPLCEVLRVALEAETPFSSMMPVLKILVAEQTLDRELDLRAEELEDIKQVLLRTSDAMNVVAKLLNVVLQMRKRVRAAADTAFGMCPSKLGVDTRVKDVVLNAIGA